MLPHHARVMYGLGMSNSPAPFLTSACVRALAGTPVVVYRNLRFSDRTVWSVAHATGTNHLGKGTLIGYADDTLISLIDATMVVRPSRVAAIAAGAHREVCAWVAGTVSWQHVDARPFAAPFTFRPHTGHASFVTAAGDDIARADVVTFAAKAWAL